MGTYEFNFSVYDALTGGNSCYSNTTALTTGNFGEWKTEQGGVNSACNNVSKDYFLNINIGGVEQTPRRRLLVWNFLRKNVDEVTNGSIETNIIKVRIGLKDLNKDTWQSKLNYARELANTSLISQKNLASKLIITTTTTGESVEFKIMKLQQAGEQAKNLINSEFEIAQAKILEAKKLALLNGEKPEDAATIEAEANLHLIALNLTAQQQLIVVEQELNKSITNVIASDDGIRFCLSNGTNCQNNPVFNNITANTGFFSFLGSLTNRITKLFIQDIDFTGNINGTGNIITSQDITSNYATAITGLFTNLNTTNITAVQYNSVDAGESKTGLTSSQFRVCKKFKVPDNACEEWCKLEITGGIITRCK